MVVLASLAPADEALTELLVDEHAVGMERGECSVQVVARLGGEMSEQTGVVGAARHDLFLS